MLCLTEKDSFVLFQKPNSNIIYFIKGNWTSIASGQVSTDGFIIRNIDGTEGYLMDGLPIELTDQLIISNSSQKFIEKEIPKHDYIKIANKFIEACQHDLQKVILSRKKLVNHQVKNIFDLYQKICNTYNHSFNYLLNIPSKGMWMGATPENLINGKNNRYTTVSLAGSKNIDGATQWTKKEYKEQQYVTDFIDEKLKQLEITFSYSKTPETILAGNIHHLQTIFDIETSLHPLNIATAIHPTPAICGIPQQKALEFIAENEEYRRDFYTGYLGFLSNNETLLFVNLRCMKIAENTLELFVGGGITKDSTPEKEWEETELKAQTLLSVIEKM